ncbi:acyltransferase [Pseudoduganella sp. LjRoot289]|uniref:acyltransferase family protein n=1 Tax=Pseudoduganella sp. LjRoot289 TaxID=3342314 RepID=UPI003ECD0546
MKTPALYFPTLDGLRFFAFFLVLLHHLPPSASPLLRLFQEQGWVGVHVFLFLSAYLLTAILRAEWQASGGISVRKFYMRRALRIWPLYFGFCVALFALTFIPRTIPVPHGDWFRFLGQMLFVDNIISGFRGYGDIPFTPHLWTISLEEQFYLFLPLMLASFLASSRRLVSGLLAIWLLFLGARLVMMLNQAPHPMIWTSMVSADSLLLGTLLGALRPVLPDSVPVRIALLAGGTAALFGGMWLTPIGVNGIHQVYIYTVTACGAAALTMAALHEPWLGFLASRPLRYLGKISYGLYVFHFMGIEIGRRVAGKLDGGWWVQAIAALLATMLLSVLSYELFERHFLKLKRKFETVRSRPV